MSIALPWSDFKSYCAAYGPGRGQPPRPARCPFCDGGRVWFNGWRHVLVVPVHPDRRFRRIVIACSDRS